jgi:hypothetical protein
MPCALPSVTGPCFAAACLLRNARGQTPIDVAVACGRGEVLNAMLLAAAGDGSEVRRLRLAGWLAGSSTPAFIQNFALCLHLCSHNRPCFRHCKG